MKTILDIFSPRQWLIIASSFIILAVGTSLNFNFGIFIKPLVEEFDWSRTTVSAGFSVFMLAGSFSAILTGGLADRYGTRRVVFFGTIMIAAAMFATSRIQTAWEFYLTVGVLAGVGRSAFNTPVLAFIQRSFTRNRGLATGLAGSGGGLGIFLAAPLLGYLIASTGWRFSYLMMGIAVLVLALPALSFLRPAKDSDSETRRNGAKIEQRETNILPEASQGMAAIIRKRPFWAVMGSHATDCLCHSVILVHLVPFAIESGVPKIQAASLMSALGMGALVGRTAGGMLSDRIGPKWALFISLTLQTIPIPLLLMSPSLPVLYLIATLVGLGLGGHGTMYPVITREFYGPKRVGILFGTFTAGASAGMASGSFLGGVFHDLAGNYIPAFVFSLTMGVISLILVWLYPKGRTMSRFSALSASKPLA